MTKLPTRSFWLLSVLVLALSGCNQEPAPNNSNATVAEQVTSANPASDDTAAKALAGKDAMIAADKRTDQWFTTGGQFSETHHSTLDQINKDTVDKLGFAWNYDLYSTRGVEATPVIVDGIIYASGPWGVVYAVDGKTGTQVWRFKPKVDGQFARNACCDVVNRGVAVWDGLVYVTALDGVLYALDKQSGEIVWQADTFAGEPGRKASTGAPRVAGNVVVIGFGGAEFNARGYFTAYDLKTGEKAWRFYVVPGSPEKPYEHPELVEAAKTWDPNSLWEAGLGGTVWDAMVYDPELNLLYVGTGNSAVYPIKYRSPAGGDNLYVSSILAINPDNGRLAWHYQTTPGDQWDFTATQNMILTELELKGETRKVLMQAPKNGFFYILDRATGELLSADNFAPVNWATHVDLETGKPVLTDRADYSSGPKIMWPSTKGAHGWRAMAYSQTSGLVYIPVYESADLKIAQFRDEYEYEYDPNAITTGSLPLPLSEAVVDLFENELPYDKEMLKEMIRNSDAPPDKTFLRAWNPVTSEVAWDLEMDFFRNSGGVLSTSGGLVFHTKPSGQLNVYDDSTGELLKSIETGSGMMGSPATYSIDGEQYVVVMSGLGGGGFFSFPKFTASAKTGNYGRMIAFKLDGGEVPKPPVKDWPKQPKPPARIGDEKMIAQGASDFFWNCSFCHRNIGEGMVPNLNNMGEGKHQIFDKIVLEGLLRPNGMPTFEGILNEEQVRGIQAYLIDSAWTVYESDGDDSRVDPLAGGLDTH